MRAPLRRLSTVWQAARRLGPRQVGWYAVYQAGLRSGLWKRLTPAGEYPSLNLDLQPVFKLPEAAQIEQMVGEQRAQVLEEADEIAAGRARLFGGPPVELRLAPSMPLQHWTAYETGRAPWGVEDVKFLWEPARFGWAFTLGRAYLLTGSDRYAAAFWSHFEHFLETNPPNQGPNWTSGQEVALRLLAFVFAGQVLASSPESTPARLSRLAGAVAAHARRIVPTLSYARAQHNNHLVSEGLGLYLAGTALSAHPQAGRWRSLGWRTLCRALESQIAPDGVYAQHSTNYHRLMLQAALLGRLPGQSYPPAVRRKLAAATTWLTAQVDPLSGQAPNYGSNDGAYILPLANGGFSDYRPTVQAAARAFLTPTSGPAAPLPFPPGPWDELGLWLGLDSQPAARSAAVQTPAVLRLGNEREWAVLRAVRYTSRPSQADQLHVDLWFQGHNLALDAGTFRYNAPTPWDNALGSTAIHNTVEIDHLDQMRRAGRFLWLDWAQAEILSRGETLRACHDGYRQLGLLHTRVVTHPQPGQWLVEDNLAPCGKQPPAPHNLRLHWLLPDWPWRLEGSTLRLSALWSGQVQITLSGPALSEVSLVRGGETLAGTQPAHPTWGWISPTYAVRQPCLSFILVVHAAAPITLNSEWILE